jgi:hypothetical protein
MSIGTAIGSSLQFVGPNSRDSSPSGRPPPRAARPGRAHRQEELPVSLPLRVDGDVSLRAEPRRRRDPTELAAVDPRTA